MQVSLLNGAAVSYIEKVDAANMAGAEAEGLMAIRKQYFPQGELDDGGGAVPPTAAGMLAATVQDLFQCTCGIGQRLMLSGADEANPKSNLIRSRRFFHPVARQGLLAVAVSTAHATPPASPAAANNALC